MKKDIITSLLFTIIGITATAQTGDKKIYTAADYEHATKFLGVNTSKLVDRSNVNPTWLDDGIAHCSVESHAESWMV